MGFSRRLTTLIQRRSKTLYPQAEALADEGGQLLPDNAIKQLALLSLREAVILVDSVDGSILLFNESAAVLWGWKDTHVMDKHVSVLLGEGFDLHAAEKKGNQRVRTTKPVSSSMFPRVFR